MALFPWVMNHSTFNRAEVFGLFHDKGNAQNQQRQGECKQDQGSIAANASLTAA
jgi:hypothetical protein